MKRIDFRDQISRNKLNSFFLIVIIFVVFVLLGYVISKAFEPGYFFLIMILSILFSMTYILISYYNSSKIALASVRAKKASKQEYKQYYDLVEGLCLASGLPLPKLYILNSNQINAFSSGRNPQNSVICVTTGALEKLDKEELRGVLAHEISHIANFDIRFMTLTAVMVGLIAIISELFLRSLWFGSLKENNGKGNAIFMILGILLAIFAPILVKLVELAISRKREYVADASAVKFTRYPKGLINALKKIESSYEKKSEKENIPKAIAPLFFANPFSELGSTHPDIKKRISALERM